MESKFKVGDRVFIPSINKYAIIVENNHFNLLWHEISLLLKYDDGTEAYCLESNCKLDDSYDPTTAFLTELQALLKLYDAEIYANNNVVEITINGNTCIFPQK